MLIHKKKVLDGVYYIEIPDIDLYIQCGSPVESVKHLKKQGIISTVTEGEVSYETGPNAILLCDVMIQNGEFSNMSEFSVLQMLYKQGLIIPNHPNNTGIKPLLIGLDSQIEAQMQYIYRGNYGLISQEEIEACGIDSKLAHELFRMKLKFAFGKLHSPSNLIDQCIVGTTSKEIRDGVYIKRLELNKFEISYKNESVIVDLNLYRNQKYSSPYQLPYSKAEKNYFSIIHSGQGDGWDIHRSSFNSIISFQGRYFLVDLIPNINYILNSLSISINDIEGVFITHSHDDHIAGITALLRSDRKIKIYCPKLIKATIIKKFAALLDIGESEFLNLLEFQDLEIGEWNSIHELEVKPIISPHPVETTMYFFRTFYKDDYISYGHLADIVGLDVLKGMITEDENAPGINKNMYRTVVDQYSTKLDLKKVDVGGGMIHGNIIDFSLDPSEKIILAHYDTEPMGDYKSVGEIVEFGESDILISSLQNYDNRMIYRYLCSNFPFASGETIEPFFNFDIEDFEPNEVIINYDERVSFLFLVVSGIVEKVHKKTGHCVSIESGAIIGEKAALNGTIIESVYKAKNYVRVLKIPSEYFKYFVSKNKLEHEYSKKFNFGNGFLHNNLFNEGISYTTLNLLIDNMESHELDSNSCLLESGKVYLVLKGQINCKVNDKTIDVITENGYFGGTEEILKAPSVYVYEATEKSLLYSIPTDVIKNIPIAFWKILERYEMVQKKLVSHSVYDSDRSTFLWNSSYKINVAEMDQEHKKQLQYLDEINTYVLKGVDSKKIHELLELLYLSSKKHFEDEEVLMDKYAYPDLKEHKKIHQELLDKIKVFEKEFEKGNLDTTFLAVILKEWLLQHILEEDIKYSRFLNQKGIY